MRDVLAVLFAGLLVVAGLSWPYSWLICGVAVAAGGVVFIVLDFMGRQRRDEWRLGRERVRCRREGLL